MARWSSITGTRDGMIQPVTFMLSNGYECEIVYVKCSEPFFITSDSPLITVITETMMGEHALLRILPVDFHHVILLLQWRREHSIDGLRQVLEAWKGDLDRLAVYACREEILGAKRYIVFNDKEFLDEILGLGHVKHGLTARCT